MRFYLAARYSRIDELNQYADDLRTLGHVVDVRWLLGQHQVHDGALEVENASDDMPDVARLFAQDDLEDIRAADIFVAFTEAPRSNLNTRGGRHAEHGYALALGKRMCVIGPRENVFYCVDEVERYWSWDQFLDAVKYSRGFSSEVLP
jgi:nucleoside 2-deoxyribosyltransferase